MESSFVSATGPLRRSDFFDARRRVLQSYQQLELWRKARPKLRAAQCAYMRHLVIALLDALEIELHLYEEVQGDPEQILVLKITIASFEAFLRDPPPSVPTPSKAPLIPGPLLFAHIPLFSG